MIRLERNAAAAGVLKEETTVDLALVKVRLLETSVGNIRSASGLLENAHLELAEASKVDGQRTSDLPELLLAGGVEDGGLAEQIVSIHFRNAKEKKRTSWCSQASEQSSATESGRS